MSEFRGKGRENMAAVEEAHAQVLITLYEARDKLEVHLAGVRGKQND